MGEEEEEISGMKLGAFEEGTHDGEPEKSEDQFIRKSLKELIELFELARRTLVNFCREYTRIPRCFYDLTVRQ